MINHRWKLLACAAGLLIAACAHDGTAPPSTPITEALVEEIPDASCPDLTTSVSVALGIKENAPNFVSSGLSFNCPSSTQSGSSITLDTGDIDLSTIPYATGEVPINISINPEAAAAGYQFLPTWQESLAIVLWEEGQPKPQPVFDGTLPEGVFRAATVSSDRLTLDFIDRDANGLLYEYAIMVTGPNGPVLLDPRIRNKGISNK